MLLELEANLSIRKQSRILGIPRTGLYYKPILNDDSIIANLINESYLSSECRYGYRKITAALKSQAININHKKVLKLMNEMGIEGIYPKKSISTTIVNKENKIYPYLLKGLKIDRVNLVWSTDITYIKIGGQFMYFMAIIDLYSRYIIAYDLSHTMRSEFCVAILEKALKTGRPYIFNTDQGSQYTGNDFTKLLRMNHIRISMNHKGRCFDNIYVERLWRTLKQEVVYYYRPEDISGLERMIDEFVLWYNNKRLHQSLRYHTPSELYLGNIVL